MLDERDLRPFDHQPQEVSSFDLGPWRERLTEGWEGQKQAESWENT